MNEPMQTELSPEERRALNIKNCRTKLYAFLYALFAAPVRFFHNLHVTGKENEPRRGDGAYLVICNHLSWRDPIFLCAALHQQQPHFMAKKELFSVPVLGFLIRKLGAYPVDRGGADVGAIRQTISLLKNGTPVGMFPQGHRYNGQNPRSTPIRNGCAMMAVKAGIPILPAYIKVKNNTMKAFCRKQIIIGQPIYPDELHYNPETQGEYARIAAYLYEKVCELGDETND